jgi:hypothetical protein
MLFVASNRPFGFGPRRLRQINRLQFGLQKLPSDRWGSFGLPECDLALKPGEFRAAAELLAPREKARFDCGACVIRRGWECASNFGHDQARILR